MSELVRRRATCRLCDSPKLEKVLTLPSTPPANAFVKEPIAQEVYPQEIWRCAVCGHSQLGHVVDAGLLFSDYVYASGTSPVFIRHFDAYAESVVATYGLKAGETAYEVGSNDGVLLRALQARGMKVLGIDPAVKIAAAATASGVETLPAFFDEALGRKLRAERGSARLVAANNCMAHIDDLAGVVRGVKALLADDGVFVMEVQYLVELVRQGLWDMVYAEHVSYHHVAPLIPFFRRFGMGVTQVEFVPTHGGSIRVHARLAPPFLERDAWDAREDAFTSVAAFGQLERKIAAQTAGLKKLLAGLPGTGPVAGYGVPAKATTLMYTMGLGRDAVDFLVDDSPWKIGLLSPGLHIPVHASAALVEKAPRAVVVFAWNFAESIVTKIRGLFTAAGKAVPAIIVPLPEPRLA